MSNPFSTTFGIEPANLIKRTLVTNKIISDFSSENISNYVYIITGLRGSGKTVLLSTISNQLKDDNNWIVVDPGPKDNILENIASEIYETCNLKRFFLKGEFSFSFNGVSFSLKGKEPTTTVISLLKKMIGHINEKGKRVLITIDEIDNSPQMKTFIQAYETLIRQGYKVLLLMTGLYGSVSKFQDDKCLTLLYKAPKIVLGPLSISSIALSYQKYLGVDEETSLKLAKLTNGYAYAYQVLGYLLYSYNLKDINEDVLAEYDQYLADYVYDKLFSELSSKEQELLLTMIDESPIKNETLRSKTNFDIKTLSVYRDRLIKKGILISPKYAYLEYSLPRFRNFLLTKI